MLRAPVVAVRLPAGCRVKPAEHIVEQGDTLSSVAYRYLGNGRDYWRLVALNPEIEPDHLSIGQEIKVPCISTPSDVSYGRLVEIRSAALPADRHAIESSGESAAGAVSSPAMPKPSDGMIHALAFLLLTVLVLWFLSRSSGSSCNSARPSRCDSCRRPEAAKHPPRPARERHVPASVNLVGTAHATDADGIRVNGREIRLAGLDSPEWDQPAKRHGQWFNHGKFAKEAPAQEIGGRHVHVHVQGQDRYGRLIGVVACEGRDIKFGHDPPNGSALRKQAAWNRPTSAFP